MVQVVAPRVWMSPTVLMAMIAEADEHYPYETGGLFIGYRGDHTNKYVITDVSGPGPNALHARYTFEPDALFQEEFIRAAYENSGRTSVYLGDWHSHPDGSHDLSRRDKKTLKQISKTRSARQENPLMGIIAGAPGEWELKVWHFTPSRHWLDFDQTMSASIVTE